MKKLVVTVATGLIVAGASISNVSASEVHVQEGDSLSSIANAYNTNVDDLFVVNDLKSSLIHPNQTLIIDEQYKVEKDDTLSNIGSEFGVEVADLKEWNNLDSDFISTGQNLTIKDRNTEKANASDNTSAEESSSESDQANQEEAEAEAEVAAKAEEEAEAEATAKAEETKEHEDVKSATSTDNNTQETAEGETFSVTSTAYTADSAGGNGITSTGIDLNENPDAKVIAVDPDVIPLGSEVYVEGYGNATAGDIGGAINGNKIDVYVPTNDEAFEWGNRTVDVTVVE